MQLADIVLVVGGTLTALLAGLFYAFNVAFIPALRSLKGIWHIAAMQAINDKILNVVFFVSFFAPVFLLPLAAFLYWGRPQCWYLIASALLYIIGAVGVTLAGNVPLNDELAQFDANQLSEDEAERIRREYQGPGTPWMRYHNVRTLTTTAATALIFIACLCR